MGSKHGPRELVDQLASEVTDRRVLDAIAAVPRDSFVPEPLRDEARVDRPLPIGEGQTISQPLVVARMCELLELDGDEVVLDVGTGSGYHAAVLARLAREVVSIERSRVLSRRAALALASGGVDNVTLVVGDGSRGYASSAPYDAICVAAASVQGVPADLEAQLSDGGRLVVPVDGRRQRLVLVRRRGEEFERRELDDVRFVPLVCDEETAAVRTIVDLVE
jgi:protein-L-isoaspartate(D-aspartate) O-methyltransferase